MAVIKPVRPLYPATNPFRGASIYASPALSPMPVMASIGTQRNLMDQYKYTLQQMAVSPFSVNSKTYMERIKETYGITDSSKYELYGNIGGFIGAGVGAALGTGMVGVKGLINYNSTFNPMKWRFKNPLEFSKTFKPKRYTNYEILFHDNALSSTYKKYSKEVTRYNDTVNTLEDALNAQKIYTQSVETAEANYGVLKGTYEKILKTPGASPGDITDAKKSLDTAEEALKNLKNNKTLIGDSVKAGYKNADEALGVLKAHDVVSESTELGGRIATKKAGFLPAAGLALDVTSLGLSASALQQSIAAGDVFNTVFNTISVIADTADVIGGLLSYTPAAKLGAAISLVAGIVGIGTAMLQGWLVGETVGRSLSPEGMRAQQMFAENLYASMINRPVGTIASGVLMMGIPALLGALGSKYQKPKDRVGKYSFGAVKGMAYWLTETSTGNFMRSVGSMLALQTSSQITQHADNRVPWAPKNPEDVNFVSAISIYGDINDNLFGATRNKSILVGLISGDPDKMINAMARSWGHTDDIYESVSFDHVRQELGWDLSPIGNSLFSIVGELLIDPQNIHESLAEVARKRVKEAGIKEVYDAVQMLKTKVELQGSKFQSGPEDIYDALVKDNGILRHASAREVNGIVDAFIRAKSYTEFRDNFVRLYTSYQKGVTNKAGAVNYNKSFDIQASTNAKQLESLHKFLTDLFTTGRRVYGMSEKSLEAMRTNYAESLRIANAEEGTLKPEEDVLRKQATQTIATLKKYYASKGYMLDDTEIMSRFISDMKLKLEGKHLVKLYYSDKNIRHHLDIVNTFAGNIVGFTNPTSKIIKGVQNAITKYNARSRSYTSSKKRQRQLLSLDAVSKQLDKAPTEQEVANYKKDMDTRQMSVPDQLAQSYGVDEGKVDEILSVLNIAKEDEEIKTKSNETYTEELKEQEDTIENLKKAEAEYDAAMDEFVYIPQVYSFGRYESIHISKSTINQHKQVVVDFETEDGVRLSDAEVKQKVDRALSGNNKELKNRARTYINTVVALDDYLVHTKYYDALKDITVSLRTSVSYLSSLNTTLHKEFVNVLDILGTFKQLSNMDKEVNLTDILNTQKIKAEALLKENQAKLKEIKANKKPAEKTVADLEKKLQTEESKTEKNDALITEWKSELEGAKSALTEITNNINNFEGYIKTNKSTIKGVNTKLTTAAGKKVLLRTFYQDVYAKMDEAFKDKNGALNQTLERFNIIVSDSGEYEVNDIPNLGGQKQRLSLSITLSTKEVLARTMLQTIGMDDVEAVLRGSLYISDDFIKGWKNLDDIEKIDRILDFLNTTLSNSTNIVGVSKLYDASVLTNIKKRVNDFVENPKGRTKTLRVGQGLSVDNLKAYVYHSLLNKSGQKDYIKNTVKYVVERLSEFSDRLDKAMESYTNDDVDSFFNLKAVAIRLYSNTLNTFKRVGAFQYIQALNAASLPASSATTFHFMSDKGETVISKVISKKDIKNLKETKSPYTVGEYLEKILNNPINKKRKEVYEERIRDARNILEDRLTQEEVDAHKEAINAREEEKQRDKAAEASIKTNVDNEINKILMENAGINDTNIADRTIYDINNLVAGIAFDDILFRWVLQGSKAIPTEDYKNVGRYTLRQSRALVSTGSRSESKTMPYTQVLKFFNYAGSDYKEHIYNVAERLVDMHNRGVIVIDEKQLVPLARKIVGVTKERKAIMESDSDLLTRRVQETYLSPIRKKRIRRLIKDEKVKDVVDASVETEEIEVLDEGAVTPQDVTVEETVKGKKYKTTYSVDKYALTIRVKSYKPAQLKKLYEDSFKRAVYEFLYYAKDNTSNYKYLFNDTGEDGKKLPEDFYFDEDGKVTKDFYDHFVKKLQGADIKVNRRIFNILGNIKANTRNIINTKVNQSRGYDLNDVGRDIRDIAEELFIKEQQDLNVFKVSVPQVAEDTPLKLIYNNKEFKKLLIDFVDFDKSDDASTTFVTFLKLFKKNIRETYKDKKELPLHQIQHVSDDFIFTFKKGKGTVKYDLFDLAVGYNLPLHVLINLVRKTGNVEAADGKPTEAILKLQARLRSNYLSLVDRYDKVIVRNALDIDEDIMRHAGVTDEELEILKDTHLAELYNIYNFGSRAKVDEFGEEVRGGSTSPYYIGERVYGQEFVDLYNRSVKLLNDYRRKNKNTHSISVDGKRVNVDVSNISNLKFFAILVTYNNKIDKELKDFFLETVLFKDAKAVFGDTSDLSLEKINKKITSLKKAIDRLKAEDTDAFNVNQIERYEKFIKNYEKQMTQLAKRQKQFMYFDMRKKADIIEAVKTDYELFDEVFSNYRDIDKNKKYVTVNFNGKYIRVERNNMDEAIINNAKGVPSKNDTIIERLFSNNMDEDRSKVLTSKAKDITYITSTIGDEFEIVSNKVGDMSLLIVPDSVHEEAIENLSDLRTLLGIENTKEFIVVTNKQYEDIKEMAASGEVDIIDDYIYTGKAGHAKDVRGYVSNIINSETSFVTLKLYVENLETMKTYAKLLGVGVGETARRLKEYADIISKKVYASKAYTEERALTETYSFKRAQQNAAFMKAVSEFLEIIDPSGALNEINANKLLELFFKNENIKVNSDGKGADIEAILEAIKDQTYQGELKTILVGNEKLEDRVKKGLEFMQANYGNSDINFNSDEYIPKNFLDTLKSLYRVISRLIATSDADTATYIKKAYPEVEELLKNKIVYVTYEETLARRKLLNMPTGKDAITNIRSTLNGVRTWDEANLFKLKSLFNSRLNTGETFETELAARTKVQRRVYSARTKALNTGEGKHEGINKKAARGLVRHINTWNRNNKDKSFADFTLPEGFAIPHELESKLKKHAKTMVDAYTYARDNNLLPPADLKTTEEKQAHAMSVFQYFAILGADPEKNQHSRLSYTDQDSQMSFLLYLMNIDTQINKGVDVANVDSVYKYLLYDTVNRYTTLLSNKLKKYDDENKYMEAAMNTQAALQKVPGYEKAKLGDPGVPSDLQSRLFNEELSKLKEKEGKRSYAYEDGDDIETVMFTSAMAFKRHVGEATVIEKLTPAYIFGLVEHSSIEEAKQSFREVTDLLNEYMYTNRYNEENKDKSIEYTVDKGNLDDPRTATVNALLTAIKAENESDYLTIQALRAARRTGTIDLGYSPAVLNKLKDLVEGKTDSIDFFEGERAHTFFSDVNKITERRKYLQHKFKNSFEMWNLLANPIYNNRTDFMNFVKAQLGSTYESILSIVGIKTEAQRSLIKHAGTLDELMRKLYIDKDEMYVFIHMIEALRQDFRDSLAQKDGLQAGSWKYAHKRYVKNYVMRETKELENRTSFMKQPTNKVVFHTDFKTNIDREVLPIYGSLKYVSDKNKILGHIIDLNTKDRTISLRSRPVVNVSNKTYITAKNYEQQLYSSLYGRSYTGFKGTNVFLKYNHMFGDVVLDLMAERAAKSLDTVAVKPESIYHLIRGHFTRVFQILQGEDFKDIDFIKMQEVAIALHSLRAVKSDVKFYANQFDAYVKLSYDKFSVERKEIDKALTKLTRFFNSHDSLVTMDVQNVLAKAVLGHIMESSRNMLFENKGKLKAAIRTFVRKSVDADHLHKVNQIESISNQMLAARSRSEILKIIQKHAGKPTEEEKELVTKILEIQKATKNLERITERQAQYDTIDHVNEVSNNLQQQENIHYYRLKKYEEEREFKISQRAKARTAQTNLFKFAFGSKEAPEDYLEELIKKSETLNTEVEEAQASKFVAEDKLNNKYNEIRKKRDALILEIATTHPEILLVYKEHLEKVLKGAAGTLDKINIQLNSKTYNDDFKEEYKKRLDPNYVPAKEGFYMLGEKEQRYNPGKYEKLLKSKEEIEEKIMLREHQISEVAVFAEDGTPSDFLTDEFLVEEVKKFIDNLKKLSKDSNTKAIREFLKTGAYDNITSGQRNHLYNLKIRQAKANARFGVHIINKMVELGIINKPAEGEKYVPLKEDVETFVAGLDSKSAEYKKTIRTTKYILSLIERYESVKKISLESLKLLNSIDKKDLRTKYDVLAGSYKKMLAGKLPSLDKATDEEIVTFIKDISDFISDSLKKKKRSKIIDRYEKQISTHNKTIEEKKTQIGTINNYVKHGEKTIEDLSRDIAGLDDKIASEEAQSVIAHESRIKDKSISNSNIGTFKKLHPKFELSTDDEIVEHVVSNILDTMDATNRQRVEQQIEENGGRVAHNDIVDTFITAFNFVAQTEAAISVVPDRFNVIDMETITTPSGKTPYSITLLLARRVNGSLVYDVYTTTMNNQVFTNPDKWGAYMVEFYEQQRQLARSRERVKPGYNEELVDAQADLDTDALIKKISNTRNYLENTEILLRLINMDPDTVLVAHNGANFDFPHYDRMLDNLAKRTLMSTYYNKLSSHTLSRVRQAWKESPLSSLANVDSTGRLLELYTDERAILLKAAEEGTISATGPDGKDSMQIKELRAFTNAMWQVRATAEIEEAMVRLGYTVDNELRERLITGKDSKLNQAKSLIIDWLDGKDREENRKKLYYLLSAGVADQSYDNNAKADLIKELDTILKNIEDRYKRLKEDGESITFTTYSDRATLKDTVLKKIDPRINIQDNTRSYKELIDKRIDEIKRIEEQIRLLDKHDEDFINKELQRSTDELSKNKAEIEQLRQDVEKKEEEIKTQEAAIDVSFDDIIVAINKINQRIMAPVTSGSIYIKRNINDYVANKKERARAVDNVGLLGIELTLLQKELNDKAIELENIVRDAERVGSDPASIEAFLGRVIPKKYQEAYTTSSLEVKTNLLKSMSEDVAKLRELVKDLNSGYDVFSLEGNKFFKEVISEVVKRIEGQINSMHDTLAGGLKVYGIDFVKDEIKSYKDLESYKQKIKDILNDALKKVYAEKDLSLTNKALNNFSNYELYKEDIIRYLSKLDTTRKMNGEMIYEDLKYLYGLMDTQGKLKNAYDLYQENEQNINHVTTLKGFRDLLKRVASEQLVAIESAHNYLNSRDLKEGTKLGTIDGVNIAFNQYLEQLSLFDETKDTVVRNDLFNIMVGGDIKRSLDMVVDRLTGQDEEAYYASRRMDTEILAGLGNNNIKRAYLDARRGDDKWAIELDPTKVYYTTQDLGEGGIIYTYHTYDSEHDTVQKMSFNSKAPDNVQFDITYNFIQRGFELTKVNTVTRTFKNKGLAEGADPWETEATTTLDIRSMVRDMFAEDNTGVRGFLKDSDLLLDNGIDHSRESINRLVNFYYKNKNKLANDKERANIADTYHDMALPLHSLKAVNYSAKLRNRLSQYLRVIQVAKTGTSYKDIAKLRAGLYAKMLAPFNALEPGKALNKLAVFSTGFVPVYDQEHLNKFADGQGIILENSSEGSAGSTFTLRSFYDVVIPFRQNTNTIRTVLSYKKFQSSYTPIGVNNAYFESEDREESLEDFLEKFHNEKTTDSYNSRHLFNNKGYDKYNPFIPSVLTSSMKDKYDRDILHKIGMNADVVFTNMPEAFEDTILVDLDDALAMGWDEGNKSWLGLYGFKGAVRYRKDLRKDFGATFMANYDSVSSRGSYGVKLEMAINNINDYNKGILEDGSIKDTIKKYDKEFKKYFETNSEGQIIIDPYKNYDTIFETIARDAGDEEMLEQLTNVTKGNMTFKRGKVYVFMDAEHEAEHMANKTELSDLGEIKQLFTKYSGSAMQGVSISPSVVNIFMTKGATDWNKVFKPDTKALENIQSVMYKGLPVIVNQLLDKDNPITLKEIEEHSVYSLFLDQLYAYVNWKKIAEDDGKLYSIEQIEDAKYRMNKIDLRVRNQAKELLSGRNGVFYESYYRRHPGIRGQLLANTDLQQGEIKVSLEGIYSLVQLKEDFLLKRDGGMGRALDEDERKEVMDKIESIKLKGGTVREMSHEFNEWFTKNNYFGRVLGVRSPVQDYNATPILEIVGISLHYATEANRYLYGMIGGDNDGDTIGLAVIGAGDFANNPGIRNLDSTKDIYYDNGYKEKIDISNGFVKDPKLTDEENEKRSFKFGDNVYYMYNKPLGRKDIRYANTGKKTFSKVDIDGKTYSVRNHFSWYEMYRNAFDLKTFKELVNGVDSSKVSLDLTKQEDIDKLRMFVNVLIREDTGGLDNVREADKPFHDLKDYFDLDKLKAFYTEDNKARINKLIAFEDAVDSVDAEGKKQVDLSKLITKREVDLYKHTLSEQDQEYIRNNGDDFITSKEARAQEIRETLAFEIVYSALMMNTIARIQTSKRGVNIMGGNRKLQLVASIISHILEINQDRKGIWWSDHGLTNKDGDVTIESIIEGMKRYNINLEQVKKENPELIKQLEELTNKQVELSKKALVVFDKLAEGVVSKDNYKIIEALEMHNGEHIFVKGFVEHLKEESDKAAKAIDLASLDSSGKKVKGKYTLTNMDKQMLSIIFFGRFDGDARAFFSAINNKEKRKEAVQNISDSYLKQFVIGRKELESISDKATMIIAVSKHFGFDINPSKFLTEYTTSVKESTSAKSIRTTTLDKDTFDLNLAIAFDKDKLNKEKYVFSNNDKESQDYVSKRKDAIKGTHVEIKDKYTDVASALSDYNSILKEQLKQEFFGDQYVPEGTFQVVNNAVIKMLEVFNRTRNVEDAFKILNNLEEGNPIETLINFNVPAFRVNRALTNSYTLFSYMSSLVHLGTGKALPFDNVPFIKEGTYFFELTVSLWNKRIQEDLVSSEASGYNKMFNWLMGTLDTDEKLFVLDKEDGTILPANLRDEHNKVRTFQKESMSAAVNRLMQQISAGTQDFDWESLEQFDNGILSKIAETAIKRSNIQSLPTMTVRDIVEQIRQETDELNALVNFKHEQIKRVKGTKITNLVQDKIKLGNSYVYNYYDIAEPIKESAAIQQRIYEQTQEVTEIKRSIERLETAIGNKTNEIKKKQEVLKHVRAEAKGGDNTLRSRLVARKASVEKDIEGYEETMKSHVFNEEFSKLVRYLTVEDGKNIFDITKRNNIEPKPFTNKDAREFRQRGILDFTKMQVPFMDILEYYEIRNSQGTVIDYDWEALYKYYKANYQRMRLTHITHGDMDEGLLKRLHDIFRKRNDEYDNLTNKQKRKQYRHYYDSIKFRDLEALKIFQDEERDDILTTSGGSKYKGLAKEGLGDDELSVAYSQDIVPTLKEFDIKSAKDLEKVYTLLKESSAEDKNYYIGFSYVDDILTSMNRSYNTFRMDDNILDRWINSLNKMSKVLMRWSPGFLFRNFMDTWNQLYSEIYSKHGVNAVSSAVDTAKLFAKTLEIDHIYNSLNDELRLNKANIRKAMDSLENINKRILDTSITAEEYDLYRNHTKEIVELIYHDLIAYDQGMSNLTVKSLRNEAHHKKSKELIKMLDTYLDAMETNKDFKIQDIKIKDIEKASALLLQMRFGEFYLVQEEIANMMESGKIQHTNSKAFRYLQKAHNKYKTQEERNDMRTIIAELGYFMSTNAQLDDYAITNSQDVNDFILRQKQLGNEDTTIMSYEEIIREMDEATDTPKGIIGKSLWLLDPNEGPYGIANTWIERTGRIAGFYLDRFLYLENMNDVVANSLKRFFNYGQRSPMEVRLTQDIPYLSFPVRTINNWIDRITDPRYIRLLDDILEGIYAQYRDEDGQYSDYMKYQIQSGWIPITKSLGVRAGNGAFDVYNILTDTSGEIATRSNPIGRFMNVAMNNGSFGDMLKQFATVGATSQVLNAATALTGSRELAQQVPIMKEVVNKRPASLGTSVNMFYDINSYDAYKKYTPKSYVTNGRYVYYENTYKDWFNKYGRMRKPKVDPVSLVRDIQWKTYVRWKRLSYRRKLSY